MDIWRDIIFTFGMLWKKLGEINGVPVGSRRIHLEKWLPGKAVRVCTVTSTSYPLILKIWKSQLPALYLVCLLNQLCNVTLFTQIFLTEL